jgi:hypothetical protein
MAWKSEGALPQLLEGRRYEDLSNDSRSDHEGMQVAGLTGIDRREHAEAAARPRAQARRVGESDLEQRNPDENSAWDDSGPTLHRGSLARQ